MSSIPPSPSFSHSRTNPSHRAVAPLLALSFPLHYSINMADEEKLIADAFHQAFKKTTKIPPELYVKMNHELRIDDSEPLKVNLTMKRGLVLDIEEDSLFRTFLTIGDIVLTINDKVASRPDFKLTDAFKDRGSKMISIAYIRLRNYSPEEPPLEEGERRDNYEYKVAVIYCLQRMTLGMAMEGLSNRVYITSIQPKSLGSLCAAIGDVILHVNGKRVCDTDKAMTLIMEELENKSHFKITLERAKTEEARAQVQFAISKENRDPPVPVDCTAYIEKAINAMKGAEPKSILRMPRVSVAEAVSVGFHDRITTENVIPSDVADEALIKTPARVPNAPGQPTAQPSSNPAPPSSEAADRTTEMSVTKPTSVHDEQAVAKKAQSKEVVKISNRKGKGSSKKIGGEAGSSSSGGKSKESVGGSGGSSPSSPSSPSGAGGTSSMMATSSTMQSTTSPIGKSFREWRKRLSTEIFFGRNRKKSAGSGAGSGSSGEAAKNQKKKKGKKENTNTSTNDTEGNQ